MNYIDLIIILIVALFGIEGIKRGFFIQLADIIGFLLSLIVSLTFYSQAAKLLIAFSKIPKIAANPIGFFLVWIIVESIYFIATTIFLRPILQKVNTKRVNKILGFIPSSLNALLFLSFLLLFIISLPVSANIKKPILNSKIGSALIDAAGVLEKPLNNVFGPITKESLTFLTVKPEETTSVPLGFTTTNVTVDYQSEQKMFALVNMERQKQGVASLLWSEKLAEVGRNHSKDMFARGYFSHFSPEQKDVGDRLADADISYEYAGENLALAPDLNRAHTGLMNSPGHKRNILDPAFKKIGIGVIDGGVYGELFTQVFTN